MKYAVEAGSGIQKLIRGIHRQQGDLISLFLFLQNMGSRLTSVYVLKASTMPQFTKIQDRYADRALCSLGEPPLHSLCEN
jgi:hypothetical protein